MLVCLVLAGCDSPFVEDFKSIYEVVEAVAQVANTEGVNVNIRNGLEMSIVVADSPINAAAENERQALADRIALLGLKHYAHADELQAISVEFISAERKYLIVNIRTTIGFYRFTRQRLDRLQRASQSSRPLQNQAARP